MKYPCKTCLVQAACRPDVECKEYDDFVRMLKNVASPLSIGLGSILFITLSFVLMVLYDEDIMFRFVQLVWLSTMFINIFLAINFQLTEFYGILMLVGLAPLVFPQLLIVIIFRKKYKRA